MPISMGFMRSIERSLIACSRTGAIAAVIGLLALVFAASGMAGTVTVAPGETLSHVAARNGVSVADLAAANGIADPDHVVAGTRLQVSSAGGGGSASSAPAGGGTYRVVAGDTLSGIAARHGTSADALAGRNGIPVDGILSIGTVLTVTGSVAGSAPAASATPSVGPGGYVVAPGDTLSGIAARHGTSAAAIARANGISDANMVIVGTSLSIPGGSSGAAAAPAAAPAPSGGPVASLLDQASARHGVPADLSRAVAWQESGWSQSARSSVGAIGVMQLMPDTARWFGPNVLGRSIDPYSVSDNVDTGVAYLAYLQRELGDPDLAVGAYYRGPNAVREFGLGTETQAYVSSVRALRGTV